MTINNRLQIVYGGLSTYRIRTHENMYYIGRDSKGIVNYFETFNEKGGWK